MNSKPSGRPERYFCFFLVATVASQLVVAFAPRLPSVGGAAGESRELNQLVVGGLVVGLIFHGALLTGLFNWLGYFFGLGRAIVLTLTTASCYLFGVAYGRRELSGSTRIVALTLLVANITISWMSLFLVGGLFFLLAALLGYAIAAARIPWRVMLVGMLVVTVLHAGKSEMRQKYWEAGTNYNEYYEMPSPPDLMMEWTMAGLAALAAGDVGKDVTQRASLVWVLLHVQRVAPTPIPFLDGATYAFLPQMLVPRFLDPEKIPSQAGMNLLNVHFGLLTEEATQKTAVGWGPIGEGYANFGFAGVAGAAIAIGLIGGALTWWSAGAAAVSLPALFAIAAMLQMTNMEADMSGLLTSMLQGMAAVIIYFGIFRFLTSRAHKRTSGRPYSVSSESRRG